MEANPNTLTISLHLLTHDYTNNTVENRAELYTKLSQAAQLANDFLQQHKIWSCGGDGIIFGVHCVDFPTDCPFKDDVWHDHLREELEGAVHLDEAMPHLRGICRYGNDVNDAWRAVSLMLELSALLSSKKLSAAIECLDQDGQLILIEAAEVLPNWVDEDVSQGGVGGPRGCVNRCWIVDGLVRLIPLQSSSKDDLYLKRRDALEILRRCIDTDELAVDQVQNTIEARIARTDYTVAKRARANNSTTIEDRNKHDCGTTHYQIAAAAVPASVAYFLQNHSYLTPFLVDSFCNMAPEYLDNVVQTKQASENKTNGMKVHEESFQAAAAADQGPSINHCNGQSHKLINSTQSKHSIRFGNHFRYERIVLIPITMTRTTYAELITGRGIVPCFPIPNEYRSVELNRFQRQLLHMTGERNVWRRAVELGIRLSAGLEWILHGYGTLKSQEQESFLQSMGDVERRLRIHWCKIDAEAISNDRQADAPSWIEQNWQKGPNNNCNNSLSNALQTMCKCHVFHPELSKTPYEAPCPYSRPGVSLYEIAHSGMKQALRWTYDKYADGSFQCPREWELDDDSWMDVNSLEEFEDEMKNLSSTKVKTVNRPRRTTRRSRRNVAHSNGMQADDNEQDTNGVYDGKSQEIKALNKMIHGVKTLVEGEGDIGGVVTQQLSGLKPASPRKAMLEDVHVNPGLFLSKLPSKSLDSKQESMNVDSQDVSKFFFKKDLAEDDDCDDSSSNNQDMEREDNFWTKASDDDLGRPDEIYPSTDVNNTDFDMISNLLSSLEAEGDIPGPVTSMLASVGICPPRLD